MTSVHEQRKIAAAIRRLERLNLQDCFDPNEPESRPTSQQVEILKDAGTVQYRWVVAGNQSGKSQLAAREISWILTGTHPYWQRPTRWGDEPLMVIVAGQDRKNMEISLWENKIARYLDKSEWREVRQGGVLQYVQNKNTNDTILFVSHSDSGDKNRRHMQGYVAHYVWLDEMPSSVAILEELQRRVDTKKGLFIATFTPKFRNDAIRRVIDSSSYPLGKKYQMSKLDNPKFSASVKDEIAKLEGYSEAYKRAVLYGDWFIGDSQVYEFNSEFMAEDPPGYHPSWRHVESVDPALKSKFGYTLWAECPTNGIWYLVKSEYIENIFHPEDMLTRVQELSAGYNIARRVCDPHEAWYLGTASKKGIHYMCPFDKNSRKNELIKGLQAGLSSGKVKISPWCAEFIDEVQSCQWSETAENKIVNASSYHLLDTAQYFVDCMPPYDETLRALPWHQELREGNERRKKASKAAKIAVGHGGRVAKQIGRWGVRAAGRKRWA